MRNEPSRRARCRVFASDHGAVSQVSHSSGFDRITGIAFGWTARTSVIRLTNHAGRIRAILPVSSTLSTRRVRTSSCFCATAADAEAAAADRWAAPAEAGDQQRPDREAALHNRPAQNSQPIVGLAHRPEDRRPRRRANLSATSGPALRPHPIPIAVNTNTPATATKGPPTIPVPLPTKEPIRPPIIPPTIRAFRKSTSD